MHMRLIDVPWQQLSVSLDSGVVCRLRSAVDGDRKLLWDIWGRRRMGSGRRMEREKNNRPDLDRRRDCGNIVMEIKFWLAQLFFFSSRCVYLMSCPLEWLKSFFYSYQRVLTKWEIHHNSTQSWFEHLTYVDFSRVRKTHTYSNLLRYLWNMQYA